MVLYPMITSLLGLGKQEAGVFLGGTIHDVAQVVGAGYGMSKETGDVATIVKLLRVAMLLPVILVITLSYRKHHVVGPGGAPKPPLLPWFVVAFALIVVITSRPDPRGPAARCRRCRPGCWWFRWRRSE
jgi:uncharacterized membrane protein YadS